MGPLRTSPRMAAEEAEARSALLAATEGPADLRESALAEGPESPRSGSRPGHVGVRIGVTAALFGVAGFAASQMASNLAGPRSSADTAGLRARPRLFEAPSAEVGRCERCPVGECDRQSTASCYYFMGTEKGYHCQVSSCSEVPTGEHFSPCWAWEDQSFYSYTHEEAPCTSDLKQHHHSEVTTSAPAKKMEVTTSAPAKKTVAAHAGTKGHSDAADAAAKVNESQPPPKHNVSSLSFADHSKEKSAAQPPPREMTDSAKVEKVGAEKKHAAASEAERKANDANKEKKLSMGLSRALGKSLYNSTEVKATSTARPATTAKPTATATPTTPTTTTKRTQDTAIHLGRVEVERDDDPQLTAYWDTFSCGPAGDDHNSEWCGGHTHAPKCKNIVDTDLCESGKARLVSVRGRDGETNFFVGSCMFIYFAQYGCVKVTSTSTATATTTTSRTTSSTTSTTVTSTRTTTITLTNSTTSTTTTTLLTTTGKQEGRLLKDVEAFEKKMLKGDDWSAAADFPAGCDSQWKPPSAPEHATDLNGVQLPDVCFKSKGPHRVMVIGDWGGQMGDSGPVPANQRPDAEFVWGVDDLAQTRVAGQMAFRANLTNPDYILNAGDNFYWGGLEVSCGIPAWTVVPMPQFQWVFEEVYKGPGLDGKPWLGVLGNHDYGGFQFMKGWDQLIAYTWSDSGRWVMPAQYYRSVVRYPGFSVDYFFLDTNKMNADSPEADDLHNMCSLSHNPPEASCGDEGPADVNDCPGWFNRLWEDQQRWLEKSLAESEADWQVIVTHFPPTWEQEYWTDMSRRHGIDLFVTGHVHSQSLHHEEEGNFLRPTAWIISGGGGGITSEASPDPEGNDDQYGFFELTLSKEVIQIQGFSHGGQSRSMTFLKPRPSEHGHKKRALPAAGKPSKVETAQEKAQKEADSVAENMKNAAEAWAKMKVDASKNDSKQESETQADSDSSDENLKAAAEAMAAAFREKGAQSKKEELVRFRKLKDGAKKKL